MTRYATIISIGAYLPEIERCKAAMRKRSGEAIDKFEAASGIRARFSTPDDSATSGPARPGTGRKIRTAYFHKGPHTQNCFREPGRENPREFEHSPR